MTTEPTNLVVLSYGFDISFECVAVSNPSSNYTWMKDNTVLTAAMDERYNHLIIIIIYVCQSFGRIF